MTTAELIVLAVCAYFVLVGAWARASLRKSARRYFAGADAALNDERPVVPQQRRGE